MITGYVFKHRHHGTVGFQFSVEYIKVCDDKDWETTVGWIASHIIQIWKRRIFFDVHIKKPKCLSCKHE